MISQLQMDFQARGAGLSQNQIILGELARNEGKWIDLPRLMDVAKSAAVHSRISDLRRAGHAIEHKNTFKTVDGRRVCHSFYRLIPSQAAFDAMSGPRELGDSRMAGELFEGGSL